METLVKADIFFFITTIAVLILTTILAIAGYHLIKILKNFRDMSDTLKRAVDVAEEDMENIHDQITGSWLYSLLFKKKKKPARARVVKS